MKATSCYRVLLILGILFLLPPVVEASTPVRAAPYHGNGILSDQYFSSSGDFIGSENLGNYFMSAGQATRFMQSGYINHVKFYADNVNQIATFQIQIWSKDEATGKYNLNYTTGNLVSMLQNGLNNLDLSSAQIPVSEGDSYGLYILGTSATRYQEVGIISSAADYQASIRYARSISSSEYDWYAPSTTGGMSSLMSMEFDINSPDFVFIGDSIISGHPLSYACTDQVSGASFTYPSKTMPYKFSTLTGHTYQNEGITGDSFPNFNIRFSADVISKHPQYVVLEGGVNNLGAGSLLPAQIAVDMEQNIVAAQNAGIIPIVVLINPAYGGSAGLTSVQNLQADTYNNLIIAYQNTNRGFAIVDARSTLGAYSSVNGWTLNSSYTSDGLHLNEAGNLVFATAVQNAAFPQVLVKWNTYTVGDTVNTLVTPVGAGYTNVIYHFVVNGVDYPQTTPSYSFVMTKVDFYNITTYASTDQGIVNKQLYEAQGLKKLATNHTIEVDHAGMDNLTDDVNNFDDVRLLQDANLSFTDLLGNWYWLVIFSLPFLFIWINTGTLKIPGVLFLMLGWLVIGMVPANTVFIVYIGFGCVLGSSFYAIIERR